MFPKHRNKEVTTTSIESSEDRSPLSPPPPKSSIPVVMENIAYPNTVVGKGSEEKRAIGGTDMWRKRSISSSSSTSQKGSKEDDDSSNQLYFW